MIKTFITHELYKATPTQEMKDGFSNRVNDLLKDISEDVVKWNGSVELMETKSGNYTIIAHCEKLELQNKMQKLLENFSV